MQISPINQNYNSNFKGTINPSPVLTEIKSYATKESLARFDTMVERIGKINDGLIFNLSKKIKYKMTQNNITKIIDYDVHKSNANEDQEELVYTIEQKIHSYRMPETNKKRKAMILDVITNLFENIFYQVDNKPNRPEILEILHSQAKKLWGNSQHSTN